MLFATERSKYECIGLDLIGANDDGNECTTLVGCFHLALHTAILKRAIA
jgi:hypothetical protein